MEPLLKRDLFRRLLLAIFRGEWATGGRLIETELAERFGVSRTPVREALMELAAVGLIELKPNCGAVAGRIGPEQIREIYEVRELLESEATRRACGRIPREKVEILAQVFQNLARQTKRDASWSTAAWRADRVLHELIAAHCGNRRLAGEIHRYDHFMQAIREVVGNRAQAQSAAVREHADIVAALQENNADRASEAMCRHVGAAAKTAMNALGSRLQDESANNLHPLDGLMSGQVA